MRNTSGLKPTDIIVFGGCGDLAMRKIMPALYYRHASGQLPKKGRIIATGREHYSKAQYLAALQRSCLEHVDKKEFKAAVFKQFAKRFHYVALASEKTEDFITLSELVHKNPAPGRMFYLATPASVFGTICHQLQKVHLITKHTRIVLEKPLGHDLASFQAINKKVLECFE